MSLDFNNHLNAFTPQTTTGRLINEAYNTYHQPSSGLVSDAKNNLEARVIYLGAATTAILCAIGNLIKYILGFIADVCKRGRDQSLRDSNERNWTMVGANLAGLPTALEGIVTPSQVKPESKKEQIYLHNKLLTGLASVPEVGQAGARQWHPSEKDQGDFYATMKSMYDTVQSLLAARKEIQDHFPLKQPQ